MQSAARPLRVGRRRRLLAPSLALALLFGAGSVYPESGSSAASPRFPLERITVEGLQRFSAEPIVAETWLEEGGSYTEDELQAALGRVVRLPLVLDAELSLRRGATRGWYELVIEIVEAPRWFFGLDVSLTGWGRPISVNGLSTTSTTTTSAALVGRRFQAGRLGLGFVALGGTDGSVNVGIERHRIGAREILVSAALAFSDCGTEREEDSTSAEGDEGCRTEIPRFGLDPQLSTWSIDGDVWKLRLAAVLPLAGPSALRGRLAVRHTGTGVRRRAFELDPSRFDLFRDRDEISLEVDLSNDTVDDPVFPTSGRRAEIGLSFHSLSAELLSLSGDRSASSHLTSRVAGVRAEGARWWPLSSGHTVWGRAWAFLGLSSVEGLPGHDLTPLDDDLVAWRAGVELGHARLLRLRSRPRGDREWRWESDLQLYASGTSPSLALPDNPVRGFRLGTGVALRNRWGVFRLRLLYHDLEEW